jgi:hypothetical protein
MAFTPDNTFDVQDLLNQFNINVTAVAGTPLTQNTADTSPLGVGDQPYGSLTTGSLSVADDRIIGVLFYDVTATGPTYFDQTAGVLNYSSPQGQPCAVWKTKPGDIMATTAFASSGTGAITAGQASGNTSLGTILGVINGQFVVQQGSGAGSVAAAKLIGNALINGAIAIRVQLL